MKKTKEFISACYLLFFIFLADVILFIFDTPKKIKYFLGELYVGYLIVKTNLKAFFGFLIIPLICYTTKLFHAIKQAKNKRMELQARKRYFGRY